MGRPPTPSSIQKLQGTYRKDRRKGEPKPAAGVPSCPAWIGKDGKQEWNRVVKELVELGVLTQLDRATLALYCQAYDDYVSARRKLKEEGFTTYTDKGNVIQHPIVGVMNQAWQRVLKAAVQLGLTPAARTRVQTDKPDPDDDLGKIL